MDTQLRRLRRSRLPSPRQLPRCRRLPRGPPRANGGHSIDSLRSGGAITRSMAPSISGIAMVLFDEIDAVGRQRGARAGNADDGRPTRPRVVLLHEMCHTARAGLLVPPYYGRSTSDVLTEPRVFRSARASRRAVLLSKGAV